MIHDDDKTVEIEIDPKPAVVTEFRRRKTDLPQMISEGTVTASSIKAATSDWALNPWLIRLAAALVIVGLSFWIF